MKPYLISVGIVILAACTATRHSTAPLPRPVTAAHSQSSGKPFEVVYQQKAYKVNHPLKWRTVNDAKLGSQPDWNKLDQIRPGMAAESVRSLLGKPWYQENIYINEWNYLYRYPFNGKIQQCQYKIVFHKRSNQVEGIFWEPVGQAHCKH
ncbi:MAG: outer membrane protein assembly factor BamE [Neisseria sp.]|uniref:outer membrane protein assembly factor BamE n=1 Tax=Neisseria sp. TaxID=192066 RepID=UPI0026DCA4C9|nr:outer membrane protein assembly factor BamE [Neisseria sp.]MDO4640516.1 outer membrane protein assembly factor BamE [Neisseria sp.]